MQEDQGLAFDREPLHGQFGGLVDVAVVVDDEDAPGSVVGAVLRVRMLGLVEQFEQVVVSGGRFLHGGGGSGQGGSHGGAGLFGQDAQA